MKTQIAPTEEKKAIEILMRQNEMMKQLSTKSGFCDYYFQLLPKVKTTKKAFSKVNKMYFDLFGEYRYTNFESFKFSNVN